MPARQPGQAPVWTDGVDRCATLVGSTSWRGCDPRTAEPKFVREDERLIYDTITELNVARTLSQAAYKRALADLGLDLLIELITAAGFYTMVAMILSAFDAPVPGGEHPLP
jgi:hypothetical protein